MYKQYNTPETAFVLNLDFDISPTHDARFISLFVDSIPDAELLPQTSHTGRPAHHPRMLLKMILFAYSRKVFSGRKIAQMNEESIPMKWLSRDEYVCYRSINAFRVHSETSILIQKAFIYFTFLLSDHDLIKDDALYIDGTKVEADANRYSFVWRKAVERYEAKLNENIKLMYDELVEQKVQLAITEDELDTSEGLQEIIEAVESRLEELEEAIVEEPNVIEGGSQNKRDRRTLKKHHRKLVEDFLPRKKKYQDYNDTFEGRNSFSKTDTDATFMCMKEDAMKNRVLKPGYNLQIATNSQFVIGYDIFPNPSDSRTLRPFLESIATLNLFSSIVADAGYGSEENYAYVIDELEKEAVIAYGMHHKEQKKAYQNDPTRRENWHYDEELDCYVDHHGVQFSFSRYIQRTDKNGFTRDFKLYTADKAQETPELDALALTEKGNQRTTSVNPVWESFKAQAKETLASESGSQKYAQRKIDVETVFGRMKRNFGVRRTHVRGENEVRNDLGILLMTMNLMKLAEMIRSGAVKMRENTSKNSTHKNNQRTLLVLSSMVVYLGLFAQSLLKIMFYFLFCFPALRRLLVSIPGVFFVGTKR